MSYGIRTKIGRGPTKVIGTKSGNPFRLKSKAEKEADFIRQMDDDLPKKDRSKITARVIKIPFRISKLRKKH